MDCFVSDTVILLLVIVILCPLGVKLLITLPEPELVIVIEGNAIFCSVIDVTCPAPSVVICGTLVAVPLAEYDVYVLCDNVTVTVPLCDVVGLGVIHVSPLTVILLTTLSANAYDLASPNLCHFLVVEPS